MWEGQAECSKGVRGLLCGIADFGTSIAAQIIDGGWVARPIPSSPKPHATDGMDKPPTACCCREAEVRAAYETSAANCPVSGTSCPSQLQSSNYCTEHTVQQYRTHTSGFGSRCRTSRTSTRPVGMITAFAPNAIALPRATRPPWAKQRAQGALIGPIAPPIPQ